MERVDQGEYRLALRRRREEVGGRGERERERERERGGDGVLWLPPSERVWVVLGS